MWLITGGAGYIGSHVVDAFRTADVGVVVVDDLSSGYRSYVPAGVPFVEGSLDDARTIDAALGDHDIEGVVHLAGYKYAGASVDEPLRAYRANVIGTQMLLEGLVRHDIDKIVFSSSSSWYGTPAAEIVGEDTAPDPESPYGRSKVVGEWMIRDLARGWPRLRHTCLRYFNVVGSGRPDLADHSPHNLFPKVLRAITDGEQPRIFGNDYPTPDGTCVRDYVHVADLADAHLVAARALAGDGAVGPIYNVGTGLGTSVRAIVDAMTRATGSGIDPVVEARRPGDPARIVGATDAIRDDLGWTAKRDLDDMVTSAVAAWRHHLDAHGGPPPR